MSEWGQMSGHKIFHQASIITISDTISHLSETDEFPCLNLDILGYYSDLRLFFDPPDLDID